MTRCLAFLLPALLFSFAVSAAEPVVRTFNDDGAWCWFEDERAIIHNGKLIIGSVAAGAHDSSRSGDIDAAVYSINDGSGTVVELHDALQRDDHNSPAFVVRPDGRVLAMYAKHGPENHVYYRISSSTDLTQWDAEKTITPSDSSRITYSNLYYLPAENQPTGRIYDFFRGYDNSFKPSWMYSDDWGESWNVGGVYITFTDPDNPTFKQRPYVRYNSNGRDEVHFLFTEAHPRNYPNSLYHAYYKGGKLYRTDGTFISNLADGPITPASATRIFAGDANNVAWGSDIELDPDGRPIAVFSVFKSFSDHRYHYARWDGAQWIDNEIAYAGTGLYQAEQEYTGLISIDPNDTDTVYISADVDPETGAPLPSGHYEIFRGHRAGGSEWIWTPITPNASADNLRPIVPRWDDAHTALLWMRGTYTAYTNYNLDVVGMLYGVRNPPPGRTSLNLNLGGGNVVEEFGPAFAAHGGTGVFSASDAWWNGVGPDSIGSSGLVASDGGALPDVRFFAACESATNVGEIDWSETPLVERMGGSPEGIQVKEGGGFVSTAMQSYMRENAGSSPQRRFAVALAGLQPGRYDVYAVADNTYHTAGSGDNRRYRIFAGTDELAGPTPFLEYGYQVVSNTDWSRWEEGDTYARFRLDVQRGEALVLVSEESRGAGNECLFNFIQVVQEARFYRVDLNGDGAVDRLDLMQLIRDWHRMDRPESDTNDDGRIDAQDLLIFCQHL